MTANRVCIQKNHETVSEARSAELCAEIQDRFDGSLRLFGE
jgi:hypothetical protein